MMSIRLNTVSQCPRKPNLSVTQNKRRYQSRIVPPGCLFTKNEESSSLARTAAAEALLIECAHLERGRNWASRGGRLGIPVKCTEARTMSALGQNAYASRESWFRSCVVSFHNDKRRKFPRGCGYANLPLFAGARVWSMRVACEATPRPNENEELTLYVKLHRVDRLRLSLTQL